MNRIDYSNDSESDPQISSTNGNGIPPGTVRKDDVQVAAYVFGELAFDERDAFEARLANEPALAARVHEFRAVMTIARDAMPAIGEGLDQARERLSPAARATIEIAARRPTAETDTRRRRLAPLRIAVAAAVLASSSLLLLHRGRTTLAVDVRSSRNQIASGVAPLTREVGPDAELARQLATTRLAEVSFPDVPLADAIQHVSIQSGIPIVVDPDVRLAFEQSGATLRLAPLKDASVDDVLGLITQQAGDPYTYVVDHGVVRVTNAANSSFGIAIPRIHTDQDIAFKLRGFGSSQIGKIVPPGAEIPLSQLSASGGRAKFETSKLAPNPGTKTGDLRSVIRGYSNGIDPGSTTASGEIVHLAIDGAAENFALVPLTVGDEVLSFVQKPVEDSSAIVGWTVLSDLAAPGVDAAPAQLDAAGVLRACERLPNERPADMYFRFWGDNAFERAQRDPLSTFATDVDGASYTLARKYLERGVVPEKAQVRTEEFLNWWTPDVPAPTSAPVAVFTELAPSPFGGATPERRMLRVAIRTRDVAKADRPRLNLVLVIDTSGSMKEENRLELVKHGLRLLVAKLEPDDSLGIVRFSDAASVVLASRRLADRAPVEVAIQSLSPDGRTNAEAGLQLGFEQITADFDVEASNRVVLFSDGVANAGNTTAETILATVAAQRAKGIYLSTVGVGMGNHNDALLEQLADRGDGECAYVDSEAEAKRAIVDRFSCAFVPVARDMKVQVEFDPAQVARYRLLGYENRAVADQDFRNDAVDGGELGAGRQVTALYEIETTDGLADGEKPFVTAHVRWRKPHGEGEGSTELASSHFAGNAAATFEAASPGFRRSVLVAQFAEFLRRSTHAANDSFDSLIAQSRALAPLLVDPDFDQFVSLLETSRDRILATLPTDDPLIAAIDAVRRNRILRAEIEDVAKDDRSEILKQLEAENRKLEDLLKRLLGK